MTVRVRKTAMCTTTEVRSHITESKTYLTNYVQSAKRSKMYLKTKTNQWKSKVEFLQHENTDEGEFIVSLHPEILTVLGWKVDSSVDVKIVDIRENGKEYQQVLVLSGGSEE